MEDDAGGVRYPSGQQQPSVLAGSARGQGLEHDDAAPADAQIEHQRETAEMLRHDQLEGNADESQCPRRLASMSVARAPVSS